MNTTKIEWTDRSWNPIRGCSRVSEGCRHCYAEVQANRFSGPGQPYHGLVKDGRWTGKIQFVEKALLEPYKIKEPSRIFVNSMSDLFQKDVKIEWLNQIFAVMALCPQHKFQILTKRPENMRAYIAAKFEQPLLNVWLGVSAENQATADRRIPPLLKTPAAVRFLSLEPLLGPVNLNLDGIHWVIVGGESGPGARPMHPDWVRSIREQCVAVPFFFKQWGAWAPGDEDVLAKIEKMCRAKIHRWTDGNRAYRVGKAGAGRELDGRTWEEWPR